MINLKLRHIIERAVEDGINACYTRTFSGTPSDDVIKKAMRIDIMTSLGRYIKFDDEE